MTAALIIAAVVLANVFALCLARAARMGDDLAERIAPFVLPDDVA